MVKKKQNEIRFYGEKVFASKWITWNQMEVKKLWKPGFKHAGKRKMSVECYKLMVNIINCAIHLGTSCITFMSM